MSDETFGAKPSADRTVVEIGMFDRKGRCQDCIRLTAKEALEFAANVLEAACAVLES